MNSDHIIKQFEPLWGVWSVEKKLGEGTYGSVYQVSRKDWDRSYEAAVKVISIPSSNNEIKEAYSNGADDNSISTYFEDAMKNMIKEIEFMYKFKGNSHIVSYEDHWIHTKYNEPGWHIFIRMELLQPLNDYFRGRQVTDLIITRIGIQICHALESCYKNGVIHRDIKDANIFVTKDGNFKLGDFGIARELSRMGKAATMKGTPNYMAPEVYKSLEYNHTADIYSLGLVLYKLANHNRYPFAPDFPAPLTSVDNDNALLTRLSGTPLKKPLLCHETLGEIILKACEFKPEDRYTTPKDFRLALEAFEHELEIIEDSTEIIPLILGVDVLVNPESIGISSEYTISSTSKGDHTVSIHDSDEKNVEHVIEKRIVQDENETEVGPVKGDRKDEIDPFDEIFKVMEKKNNKKLIKVFVGALILVFLAGSAYMVKNLVTSNRNDDLSMAEESEDLDDDKTIDIENNASTTESSAESSTESENELTWSFNQAQIRLAGGEAFKIEIIPSMEVVTEDYKWTWSSRDEKVATVDVEGNITTVGVGKTVISASLVGTNKVYNAELEVFGNVAVASTEAATAQPVTEKATQPTTQKTTQPTTQKTTQPTTQKTTQPTTQKTTQPTTQATTQAASRSEERRGG